MADNSTQSGTDTIRDKDRAGVKTQIFGLDLNIGGATEQLMAGLLPVQGYQPAATTFSAVTATGAQSSTTATGYNVATVTLRTFTGTTPAITWKLQASDDGTNWVDLQGINNTTGAVASSWTQSGALTAGTAGPSIDYTIGAYTNVRINVTAISGTTPSAAFGLAMQSMPYEASPGVLPQLWNGTAWEPQRGMSLSGVTGDSGAKTATGTGATQTNTGNKGLQAVITLGTVSGVSPTAVFKIQGSVDGTVWYDIPGAATASLTATNTGVGITVYPGATAVTGATTAGTTAAASQPLPRFWRVAWTIGGTTPSFALTQIAYLYLVN